jgi:hypothetical protein
MGKANATSEVQVLHFFEDGPIDKAEVLFNIVAEKMRERLTGRRGETHAPAKETGAAKKRREQAGAHAPGPEEIPPQTSAA